MPYVFDLDFSIKDWTVKVDAASNYGWFEWNGGDNTDEECGGGLWFDRNSHGLLRLIDFDGVADLPSAVHTALQAADVDLSEMTFDGI